MRGTPSRRIRRATCSAFTSFRPRPSSRVCGGEKARANIASLTEGKESKKEQTMQERIDTTVYTPEQFIQDLRFTANTIQADFCERTTQRMLEVFAPEFRNCVLQWKTTSRPGDALSYRFFYNGPEDLTERAQEAGLLAATPSPLNTLQREALATFPHAMRSGIDFDAAHGLAKEWT